MNLKIVALLLIISVHQVTPFFLTLISTLYSAYQVINDAHDTYSKVAGGGSSGPSNADVIESIQDVTDKISEVSDRLAGKIDTAVDKLLKEIPRAIEIQGDLKQMAGYVQRINYIYGKFVKLIKKGKKIKKNSVEKYTDIATGYDDDAVDATLNSLHKLLVPSATAHLKQGLFALLGQQLKNVSNNRICDNGAPPSQQFSDMFETVVTTTIRGFVCEAFGYVLLERFKKEKHTDDIEDSKDRTVKQIKEYSRLFTQSERGTSKIYDSCDPGIPERDLTFYEFTHFIAPYFISQASLNPDKCDDKCENQDFPIAGFNCSRRDNMCKDLPMCDGNIVECTTQWGELKVCLNDEDTWETRRYAYYKDDENKRFGNPRHCMGWELAAETVRKGESQCPTCRCTCVEDRYSSEKLWAISLREQLADIENEKFLTGIRFKVTPNIAQIQIQQGKLGADGQFAPDSIEWKPVENIRFDLAASKSEKDTIFYVDTDGEEERLTADEDYAVLSWEQRTIYFDNIIVPDGYVVTGCRFNRPSDNKDAVQLEVHATPFNFSTTQLMVTDDKPSIWVTPDDVKDNDDDPAYDRDREELKLGSTSDPTDESDTAEVRSKPNTFLKVTHTSLERDAGGTVIPLIEALDVAGNPPFLLEGINLVYKYANVTEGAGFMAFQLQGIDVLKYLDIDFAGMNSSEESNEDSGSGE